MTDDLERRLPARRRARALDLAALRATLARRAADEGLLDVAYGTARLAARAADGDGHAARPGPALVSRRGDRRPARRAGGPRLAAHPRGARADRRGAPPARRVLRRARDAPSRCRSTGAWCAASPATSCGPRPASRSAACPATGRLPPRPGSPKAYRAAGNALGSNPIPIVVPCHRVLHAGGGLGGYTGGLDRKRYLLRLGGASLGELNARTPRRAPAGHRASAPARSLAIPPARRIDRSAIGVLAAPSSPPMPTRRELTAPRRPLRDLVASTPGCVLDALAPKPSASASGRELLGPLQVTECQWPISPVGPTLQRWRSSSGGTESSTGQAESAQMR